MNQPDTFRPELVDSDRTGIILASASPSRAALLKQAGVVFDIIPADIDEDIFKRRAKQENWTPEMLAIRLALSKAEYVSVQYPAALVIGSDSVLSLPVSSQARLQLAGGGDAAPLIFDKPGDLATLRRHLCMLRGRLHLLISAVMLARNGIVRDATHTVVRMQMRYCSDAFLDMYLAREGANVLNSVGGYHFEGIGAQLFDQVDGDHSAILGLPLVPTLAMLRLAGGLVD